MVPLQTGDFVAASKPANAYTPCRGPAVPVPALRLRNKQAIVKMVKIKGLVLEERRPTWNLPQRLRLPGILCYPAKRNS